MTQKPHRFRIERSLSLDGVDVRFGDHAALRNVSLEAKRGEVTALIGPSGAGKTTVLRAFNLLAPIARGRLRFDDQVIAEASLTPISPLPLRLARRALLMDQPPQSQLSLAARPADIRTIVGMVFQDYGLFDSLTVIQNLCEGPVRVLRLTKKEARARAVDALARFDMLDLGDRLPDTLSGGQRQRVAILRALVMRPQALLLDEITSALDPERVATVLNLLESLASDGLTIIMVTHHLDLASRIASSVAMIDNGQVIAQGTPGAILEEPSDHRVQTFVQAIRKGR